MKEATVSNEKIAAIESYLDQGIVLIPVNPNKSASGKRVPYVEWACYNNGTARPTREETLAWFEKWPEAMIGVVLGPVSGLATVDIDNHKGDEFIRGITAFTDLYTGDYCAVNTPRDGIQVWFLYDNDLDTLGNHPAFEIKRKGHLTIAPPSVRDDGQYRWQSIPFDKEDAEQFPRSIINAVKTRHNEGPGKGMPVIAASMDEGNRDNFMFHTGLTMLKGGASPDVALATLESLEARGNDDYMKGKASEPPPKAQAVLASVVSFREKKTPVNGSFDERSAPQGLRTLGEASGVSLESAPRPFALTDLGNAERLVYLYGPNIRYCHARKKWFLWTGTHWRADQTNEIELIGKDVVRGIPGEAKGTDESRWKELMKHASRSESNLKIRSMLAMAESDVPILPEDFDRDPWLLNVRNGTLDLRTGELRPPRKEDMLSRAIDVDYDPAATCPVWLDFLNTVMDGRKDLVDFLKLAVGYSLTGDTREQVLFFLYGKGANGKSTFIEAVMNLLGAYSKHTRPETFMMKKDTTSSNDIADLDGVRMVAAVELEEGKRLAEVLTKQVSGGDTLKARYLFQEYFEFRPQFKLWLCGNHKPRIRGTDHAIWRRIRLIPWDVTIPDDKQDRDLPAKLREEWPGILAWAVEGCLAWRAGGLSKPGPVMAATAAYRQEMDVLADFMESCVVREDGASITKKELYEAYTQYCAANGEDVKDRLGRKTFNTRIEDMGIDGYVTGKNVHTWLGVRANV